MVAADYGIILVDDYRFYHTKPFDTLNKPVKLIIVNLPRVIASDFKLRYFDLLNLQLRLMSHLVNAFAN